MAVIRNAKGLFENGGDEDRARSVWKERAMSLMSHARAIACFALKVLDTSIPYPSHTTHMYALSSHVKRGAQAHPHGGAYSGRPP
jgi:hypothetical protein